TARRLPAAVEVSIWYERPEREEEDLGLAAEAPLDAEALAYERELFGEEAESARLSFDIADITESEPPPDRRRVIVIPQVGLVESAPAEEEGPAAGSPAGRPVEGSTEGGR
ncbi:MAG: hypothetical protein ACF8NJ_06810, partial [Phycisphaerales bacterium JB038]